MDNANTAYIVRSNAYQAATKLGSELARNWQPCIQCAPAGSEHARVLGAAEFLGAVEKAYYLQTLRRWY